jgi:hypothetical protein
MELKYNRGQFYALWILDEASFEDRRGLSNIALFTTASGRRIVKMRESRSSRSPLLPE